MSVLVRPVFVFPSTVPGGEETVFVLLLLLLPLLLVLERRRERESEPFFARPQRGRGGEEYGPATDSTQPTKSQKEWGDPLWPAPSYYTVLLQELTYFSSPLQQQFGATESRLRYIVSSRHFLPNNEIIAGSFCLREPWERPFYQSMQIIFA